MGETEALLSAHDISKSFFGFKALENVDFTVRKGEIHALLGENGAGKSTLIKVLTGVHRPDAGTIALNGEPVDVRDTLHAQRLGVGTVYQE
ncbi:ATP-binding cassette domain-containing protein, partial [Streptococcus pyogenes]